MKWHILLAFAAGLLIAADRPKKEDKGAKELKRFQGQWLIVSIEIDGEEVSVEGWTATFKGNKVTYKTGKDSVEGTFSLDPTKKPKQIEVILQLPDHKEQKHLGIYQLTGDMLTLFEGGKSRPNGFSTKAGRKGKSCRLIVFKRPKKDK